VYSFGHWTGGQLDHGNSQRPHTLQLIEALKGVRVRAVAAGEDHSLVLSVGGDAYSFGLGGFGQLGHGDDRSQPLPKRIETLANVRAVAADRSHSLLLTESGIVYSFGNGSNGRLGLNNTDHQRYPQAIEALRGVKVSALGTGASMSFAIAADGATYGWGWGSNASFGLGNGGKRNVLQYSGLLCMC